MTPAVRPFRWQRLIRKNESVSDKLQFVALFGMHSNLKLRRREGNPSPLTFIENQFPKKLLKSISMQSGRGPCPRS
jgi:hypothetical protein